MNTTNGSTKETTPLHIWLHEVEMGAIHAGCDATSVKNDTVHAKAIAWYRAGEPVWMAIDGVRQLCRGIARAKDEDDDGRSAVKLAYRESVVNGVAGMGWYSK